MKRNTGRRSSGVADRCLRLSAVRRWCDRAALESFFFFFFFVIVNVSESFVSKPEMQKVLHFLLPFSCVLIAMEHTLKCLNFYFFWLEIEMLQDYNLSIFKSEAKSINIPWVNLYHIGLFFGSGFQY